MGNQVQPIILRLSSVVSLVVKMKLNMAHVVLQI